MNTEILPVTLTETEKLEFAQKGAELNAKLAIVENEIKQVGESNKARVTTIKTQRDDALKLVHEGFQYRQVPIRWMFDQPTGNMKSMQRLDTFEVCKVVPMDLYDRAKANEEKDAARLRELEAAEAKAEAKATPEQPPVASSPAAETNILQGLFDAEPEQAQGEAETAQPSAETQEESEPSKRKGRGPAKWKIETAWQGTALTSRIKKGKIEALIAVRRFGEADGDWECNWSVNATGKGTGTPFQPCPSASIGFTTVAQAACDWIKQTMQEDAPLDDILATFDAADKARVATVPA